MNVSNYVQRKLRQQTVIMLTGEIVDAEIETRYIYATTDTDSDRQAQKRLQELSKVIEKLRKQLAKLNEQSGELRQL